MAEPARRLWTLDEFPAFDDGTDTRHELIGGGIVAMSPAADRHGALGGRLAVASGARLRRPCEVFLEAGITLPERADTYYRADLAVSCSGTSGRSFPAEPVVIVEILSPSTAMTDRGRRLPDYRQIPSVRDVLLVSSTERRIEPWRRTPEGWIGREQQGAGVVQLQAFGIGIDLRELYEGVPPGEGAA